LTKRLNELSTKCLSTFWPPLISTNRFAFNWFEKKCAEIIMKKESFTEGDILILYLPTKKLYNLSFTQYKLSLSSKFCSIRFKNFFFTQYNKCLCCFLFYFIFSRNYIWLWLNKKHLTIVKRFCFKRYKIYWKFFLKKNSVKVKNILQK
jgi:hypothetical protein